MSEQPSVSQFALIAVSGIQAYVAARSGLSNTIAVVATAICVVAAISVIWSIENWSSRIRALLIFGAIVVAGGWLIYDQETSVIAIEVNNGRMTTATDGTKYLRALVINETSQDAFCRAYLDDVTSIDGHGTVKNLYNRAEFQLGAANGGDPESPNGYLIPANGAARHFNIFFVGPGDKFLNVQSKEWGDIRRELSP